MTVNIANHHAPLLLGATFVVAVALYWHGAGPGDGEQYFRTALAWANDGPQLAKDHWGLRQLFVLPMAASFALFGQNEFSATLPNIVYAGLLVALTWYFGRRFMGETAGFASAAFIAVSSFFVARPLEVDVYGPEIVFCALACWLFIGSEKERHWRPWLAAAGVACGLAFSIREQTAAIGIAFGLIILGSRRQIVERGAILAAGFLSIIAAEMIVYWIAAGDPLYRYVTDLNHREVSSGKELTIEQVGVMRALIRPFGDFLSFPNSIPFALAAAAGAYVFRRDIGRTAAFPSRPLIVFSAAGAISMLISSYAFNLSMPRYYPLMTYMIFLFLGMMFAAILARSGTKWAAAFAALIVAGNVAAADFTRYNEYNEARFLARLALASAEPIYTDPTTAGRARYEMIFLGADAASADAKIIRTHAPAAGDLYFKTGERRSVAARGCVIVIAHPRPRNWTHWALRASGIARLAGGKIEQVTAPPQPVELIRIDQRTGCAAEAGRPL